MKHHRILVVAVFVVVLALVGCGGGSSSDDGGGGGTTGTITIAGLPGTWMDATGFKIQITSDGKFYQYNTVSYSVSGDGSTLTLDGWDYDRTAGFGTTLVGTWDDGLGEVWTFNSSGAFTWDDYGDVDTGTYTTSGGELTYIIEWTCTATATQITVTKPYDQEIFTYTLSGDTLTIQEGLDTTVFTRQ